jgi:uncharacterized membrane protein
MPSHQQTLDLIDAIGRVVDIAGVVVIVAGLVLATAFTYRAFGRDRVGGHSLYVAYRRALGRAILLGLEILVAADIIRTVAVSPTFESVGVLGIIVLVRTFLSVSLELEISGRWPWQRNPAEAYEDPPPAG